MANSYTVCKIIIHIACIVYMMIIGDHGSMDVIMILIPVFRGLYRGIYSYIDTCRMVIFIH